MPRTSKSHASASGLTRAQLDARLPALQDKLRQSIGRRVKDAHAAEDILQDALMQIIAHAGQLRDPGKLDPWARSIARHAAAAWFRQRREQRWSDLYDRIAAADEPARDRLYEEFDAVSRLLARSATSSEILRTLALHFAFDWKPREIAGLTGLKIDTVYEHIEHAKDRLRDAPDSPLDPAMDAELKHRVIVTLWNAAWRSMRGDHFRDSTLMRQAWQFCRLAHLQYPREPKIKGLLFGLTAGMARLPEFGGDDKPEPGFGEWRRERWDQELSREADRLYREFQAMDSHPVLRLQIELHHRLLQAPGPEGQDWKAMWEMSQEIIRMEPASLHHLRAAQILRHYRGAAAAARYLEELKSNRALAESAFYHESLAQMHQAAGQWAKARAAWKKTLEWPRSRAREREAREAIAECEREMKKAR